MCECVAGADEAGDPHAERSSDNPPGCDREFKRMWAVERLVKPRFLVILPAPLVEYGGQKGQHRRKR
jgi:hypothetical protein